MKLDSRGVQRRDVLLEILKCGAAKRILPGAFKRSWPAGWGLRVVVVNWVRWCPSGVRADDARDRVATCRRGLQQLRQHVTVPYAESGL